MVTRKDEEPGQSRHQTVAALVKLQSLKRSKTKKEDVAGVSYFDSCGKTLL